MGYFDGVVRADAVVQAKCDPKAGWKRAGGKCVRERPKLKPFSDHPGRGYSSTKNRLKSIAKGTLLAGAAVGLAGAGVVGAGHLMKNSIKDNE